MSFFSTIQTTFSAWASANKMRKLDDDQLKDLGLDRYDIYQAKGLPAFERANFLHQQRSQRSRTLLG